jgi:hypothetical protein
MSSSGEAAGTPYVQHLLCYVAKGPATLQYYNVNVLADTIGTGRNTLTDLVFGVEVIFQDGVFDVALVNSNWCLQH